MQFGVFYSHGGLLILLVVKLAPPSNSIIINLLWRFIHTSIGMLWRPRAPFGLSNRHNAHVLFFFTSMTLFASCYLVQRLYRAASFGCMFSRSFSLCLCLSRRVWEYVHLSTYIRWVDRWKCNVYVIYCVQSNWQFVVLCF